MQRKRERSQSHITGGSTSSIAPRGGVFKICGSVFGGPSEWRALERRAAA